jgi:hypothetical protein
MRVKVVDERVPTWDEAVIPVVNLKGEIEFHRLIRVTHTVLPLALNMFERQEEWTIADFGDCFILTGPALTKEELESAVTPFAGDQDGA